MRREGIKELEGNGKGMEGLSRKDPAAMAPFPMGLGLVRQHSIVQKWEMRWWYCLTILVAQAVRLDDR